MPSSKDIERLFLEKLATSGLDAKDAERLGYETVADASTEVDEHFLPCPAFGLPYYNASGKPTGFYRVRYLTDTRKGMQKVLGLKERRYDQPVGMSPEVYLPSCLPKGLTWDAILANTDIPITFTEGELKAACATKNGLPTIALGGVWNFKSKGKGWKRLPWFDDVEWRGRTVFIIFDSDSATNPQVLHAQYKFAEEMCALGANVKVVNIPKVADKKHGIDDYIVEYGLGSFKDLLNDTAEHQDFNFQRMLLKMNSEVAVVHQPVAVMHFATGQLLTRSAADMLYANSKMVEQRIVTAKKKNEEDTIKYIEVSTFDKWLEWEGRNEVHCPVYEPGQDQFVEVDKKRCFNTWKGWGAVPEKGDVSLWKWLLKNILKNAEPDHIKWFEQWCAYPIQNPGVKMYSCPMLFGQMKGTGKSLLGLSLMSIYGQNGAEITDTQLEDERNVFAAEKQFVLANEVTGSDKRTMVGRLRNLITQHSVVINKKYQPDYVVRDTINYFFTSQHVDAVYMEDDERRFFVHEVLGPRLVDVDQEKVQAYDKWLKSGQCASALFHYLLSIDLTGFDPTAPAPDTKSKSLMVDASRSEIENWCHAMKADPNTCLRINNVVIPYGLYRIKELIDMFSGADNGKKTYEKSMANALRKAGFKKASHGQSCPTMFGQVNLWAIRDDADALYSRNDVGAKYDNERKVKAAAKKFAKGGGK